MKTSKWYRFIFEDGTWFLTRGFSQCEMQAALREHGKLISKTFECEC